MNFLKKILGKTDTAIHSYDDFWQWFQKNERAFFQAVKKGNHIERDFFSKLQPKLNEVKDGFYFQTGMYNDETAELIITADGIVKNIVFSEEIVTAAPKIEGWKFTALQPAMDIENVNIDMSGCKFNGGCISFYANNLPDLPDEIDITIVHDDYHEGNKSTITQGTYIFLDNFLGELNAATTIDNLKITGKENVSQELIPVAKLQHYLIWREKEFIEKYEGIRHDTEDDQYTIMEATLESGNVLLAVIDHELLEWDSKASHPWVLTIEIKYDATANKGMPDNNTYDLLDKIESEVLTELIDAEGYLYVGRQTANGIREIYFACRDHRLPSKVAYATKRKYSATIDISYDIYKDKYWKSFNRFIPH